jgi:hypothetical protein
LIQAELEVEENLFIRQAYSVLSSSSFASTSTDSLMKKGLFVDGFTTNSLKQIADNEKQLMEDKKALQSLSKTANEKEEDETAKAEKSYESKVNTVTLRNSLLFLADIMDSELSENEIVSMLSPPKTNAPEQFETVKEEEEDETLEVVSYRKRSRDKKVEAETKDEEERKKQRLLEEEQAYRDERISQLVPLDLMYCVAEVDPSLSSYLFGREPSVRKKFELLSRTMPILEEDRIENGKSKGRGTIHYFDDSDEVGEREDEKENQIENESYFSSAGGLLQNNTEAVGNSAFYFQPESLTKWLEKDATSMLQVEIG